MKLSRFEETLFAVLLNAVYKSVAAMELYSTKTAWAEMYFLLIIAEEELAKLIILPIAEELGELDAITDQATNNKRRHAYYNHRVKQEIFTSFGLQNRTHKEIEELKQSCLYVKLSDPGKVIYHTTSIKDKDCYAELKHTLRLLAYFADNVIMSSKATSTDLKKVVLPLMALLSGCIHDKVPELAKEVLAEINEKSEALKLDTEKRQTDMVYRLFTNPFVLIDFFKFAYKDDYKAHLRKVRYGSLSKIAKHLEETYLANA